MKNRPIQGCVLLWRDAGNMTQTLLHRWIGTDLRLHIQELWGDERSKLFKSNSRTKRHTHQSTYRQADRQTNGQTETYELTDRQIYRPAEQGRHTDKQTQTNNKKWLMVILLPMWSANACGKINGRTSIKIVERQT